MIARVREYRSLGEASGEWRKLGLPQLAETLLELRGRLFVFVEGNEEEPLDQLSREVEELAGQSFRCDSGGVKRLLVCMGTEQFEELSPSADAILRSVDRFFSRGTKDIPLKAGKLSFDRTLVMGVLNVTPDSFSDGGRFDAKESAFRRAMEIADQGADVLDIGGESTRPFSDPVPLEVEMERVIPIIREIAPSLSIPISVDTRKAEVAHRAIEAGASIVNDISGFGDIEMLKLMAENDVPGVLMHMLRDPQTMQLDVHYEDVVGDIMLFLEQRLAFAEEMGVRREKIIIDPGIGFGKEVEHNLEIIRRLREFRCLGRPILIGASRKGFIGRVTSCPLGERLEGSLAVAAASILNGADIVRVHDVEETVRLALMVDALRT